MVYVLCTIEGNVFLWSKLLWTGWRAMALVAAAKDRIMRRKVEDKR